MFFIINDQLRKGPGTRTTGKFGNHGTKNRSTHRRIRPRHHATKNTARRTRTRPTLGHKTRHRKTETRPSLGHNGQFLITRSSFFLHSFFQNCVSFAVLRINTGALRVWTGNIPFSFHASISLPPPLASTTSRPWFHYNKLFIDVNLLISPFLLRTKKWIVPPKGKELLLVLMIQKKFDQVDFLLFLPSSKKENL